MEQNNRVLKEATKQAHDQIERTTREEALVTGQTNIGNNAILLVTPLVDDLGILAGKTFSISSGISAKVILINHRGQKKLGMISKNHKLKPLSIQFVNEDKGENEELGEDIEEESTVANFQQVARDGDISPRSIDKKKLAGKHSKKNKEKPVPVKVQSKMSALSLSK